MIERCLRWVFFFFKSSSPICDLKKGKILLFVSFCYQNIQHMIVLPHFVSPQINSVICFHFLTQWISVLWHEREYTRMSGCIFQNMFFLQWKRIKWEKGHRQTRVHIATREKRIRNPKRCAAYLKYRIVLNSSLPNQIDHFLSSTSSLTFSPNFWVHLCVLFFCVYSCVVDDDL